MNLPPAASAPAIPRTALANPPNPSILVSTSKIIREIPTSVDLLKRDSVLANPPARMTRVKDSCTTHGTTGTKPQDAIATAVYRRGKAALAAQGAEDNGLGVHTLEGLLSGEQTKQSSKVDELIDEAKSLALACMAW